MHAFVKKSVSVVVMMVATLVAVMPAFAGGPTDGFGEELQLQILANGRQLEQNAFTGDYQVIPGTVLTFLPRFIGGKGEVVQPPVKPFSWQVVVGPHNGVVAPFRGKSQNAWVARKPGFIYVKAWVDSESPRVKFTRMTSATIRVSTSPAPLVTLSARADVNIPDGIISVDINTNVKLTGVRMYARAYYGTLDINMISDQGATWARLSLTHPFGIDYVSGSTVLYLQNGPADQTISLPDGIMSPNGVVVPIPIGPTGHGIEMSLGWKVKLSKG